MSKAKTKAKDKTKHADLERQLGFSRLPDLFNSGAEFNKRYRTFMDELTKMQSEAAPIEADEDGNKGEGDVGLEMLDACQAEGDEAAEMMEVELDGEISAAVPTGTIPAKEQSQNKMKGLNAWSDEHYHRVLSLYQD